jgi:hypothetical protein
MDLPGAEAGLQALRKATLLPVIAVSAQAGSNVELVVRSLRWLMETQDTGKTSGSQGGSQGGSLYRLPETEARLPQ